MGAHFSIDMDTVRMFPGHKWADLGELCGHDCDHRPSVRVVAWGPDVAHYELEECDGCGCRAWLDGRWEMARERGENSGFWHALMEWRIPSPTEAPS